MEDFIIVAHRSATSMFGAAESPIKYCTGPHKGQVMVFETHEAAQKQADEWTSKLSSGNVWYTVEELWLYN